MPSTRKMPERPEIKEERQWNFSALVQIITLAVAVATILPIYWSYLCRSQGQYCEGSVIAPNISGESDRRVSAKLATEQGAASFEGLFAKHRGSWPFGTRLDIVAKFNDGTEIPIDSISPTKDIEIYNSKSKEIAAFILPSQNTNIVAISAYFPANPLVRRIYELKNPISSGHLSLRNIDYNAADSTLIFDVASSWPNISLNDQTTVDLDPNRIFNFDSDRIYGDTIFVQLTETKHVKAVTTKNQNDLMKDLAEAFENSMVEFKKCREKVDKRAPLSDGEIVFCEHYQSITSKASVATIFASKSGKFVEVDSSSLDCRYPGRYVAKDKKTLVEVCQRAWNAKDGSVNVYAGLNYGDFQKSVLLEVSFSVGGQCEKLDVEDVEVIHEADIVTAATFKLLTDCTRVVVNDKPFELPARDAGELASTRMFRLDFNRYKIVTNLAPLQQ